MKVLQQSLGETQSKEVKTLPSHLMNFHWSREQKWNRLRVSTILQAKSDELHSPTPLQEDSARDDEKALCDF